MDWEKLQKQVGKLISDKIDKTQTTRKKYCGDKNDLTFDHLLPKSKGGITDWANVVTACSTCNVRKGGRFYKNSGMYLNQKPFIPSVDDLHNNGKNFPPHFLHESWMDYLYWDVELLP